MALLPGQRIVHPFYVLLLFAARTLNSGLFHCMHFFGFGLRHLLTYTTNLTQPAVLLNFYHCNCCFVAACRTSWVAVPLHLQN